MKMCAERVVATVRTLAVGMLCLAAAWGARADITFDPWVPIFKGIEEANGKMTPVNGDPKLQAVYALRIDLQDPDIRLLATPPSTNFVPNVEETKGQTVSAFMEEHKLQAAINANVYFPSDPNVPGEASVVRGILISEGRVVSSQESKTDSIGLYFTSNNIPRLVWTNFPAISSDGYFTAIAGRYALVMNGVNVANDATSPSPGYDPRTAIGLSEDNRYLIFVSIDGRQRGYSDGALDSQTADWLIRFGAYQGISMDGGGSTTMVHADPLGNAIEINKPSYLLAAGRERYIGSHLGVYAKPLPGPINDVAVRTGGGAGRITWTTSSEALCQVDFGSSTNYGQSTLLETVPSTHHSVTLTGLPSGVRTYFRIVANINGEQFTSASYFTSVNVEIPLLPLTQIWRYQTNNLDNVPWTTTSYSDANWLGQGPGLLYVEDNASVGPKGTLLPPFNTTPIPNLPITYYFRTHFTYTNATPPSSLNFSNFIDDGAVFYLNGKEIQRVRMPDAPEVITWDTLASDFSCSGDATCSTLFSVAGDALASLVRGDNVLAVEVHNYNPGSPDIVFGTAVTYTPGEGPAETAPSIDTQPKPQSVTVGGSASFTVVASGTDPLSYQWLWKGAVIAGANSATLTLNDVTLSQAGNYSVVVSNSVGSVTSDTALLTVTPPPTLQWVTTGGQWQLVWNDPSFILQSTPTLEGNPIPWVDVPGPANTSPYSLSASSSEPARFFRLRK